MFYLYSVKEGDFFQILLDGDMYDVGTLLEVPLFKTEFGIKISMWDVQYAFYDNGKNEDGSPKGIKVIDSIPPGVDTHRIMEVLFEKYKAK